MDIEVFDCQCCGECCQGQGGIYLEEAAAGAAGGLLGLTAEEFTARFTKPKYGLLELQTDQDGYCLLHDRDNHTCRIHQAKPPMCRDWPFFWGMLHSREAFEDAKEACPGLKPEASWEDFLEYHRRHIRELPPASYIFKGPGGEPSD